RAGGSRTGCPARLRAHRAGRSLAPLPVRARALVMRAGPVVRAGALVLGARPLVAGAGAAFAASAVAALWRPTAVHLEQLSACELPHRGLLCGPLPCGPP